MIAKRIFLCIGAVLWSLLIHFAPTGVERGLVDSIFHCVVLVIFTFALVAHVAELWRGEW
jgi:hypothetical protein